MILAINGRFEGFGPTFFVATAADGGYRMGYIGTEIAYTQSGYEVEPGVSLVDSKTEATLMAVVKQLLRN